MSNYDIYLKYLSYVYNHTTKKIYIDNLKGFFISLDKCEVINMFSIDEFDCLIRKYESEGLIEIRKDIFRKSFYINKVNINTSISEYSQNEITILNSFINRVF